MSAEQGEEQARRQKARDRLVLYFAKHLKRPNDRDHLARGRAIGSGAVEAQAKTSGLRLKARGARWLQEERPPDGLSRLRP